MKIAMITAQLEGGGAEKIVVEISLRLALLGHEVTVIAGPGNYERLLKKSNIKVHILPFNQKNKYFSLKLWQNVRLILNRNFDIIHIHTIPLAMLVKLVCFIAKIQTPILLTMHGSPKWILRAVYPLLRKLNITRCAVSKELAKTMDAHYIPNAVESSTSWKKEHPEQHSANHCLVVLLVSRLSKEKGIDLWLKAVDNLQRSGVKVKTKIIGDGTEKVKLQSLTNKLGLNVDFLGWQSHPWEFAEEADLFVLPSRREGEPLSLLEGMAYGLPVLATRVGGIPDLLKDGAGIVVDPSAEELEKGVREFLAQSAREKKVMIEKGLQIVSGRTWEFTVQNYLTLYWRKRYD